MKWPHHARIEAVTDSRAPGLADLLGDLADALDRVDLRGSEYLDGTLSAERDRLAGIIRTYLVPRIHDPDAPLLVVFAGPTGAGKSTLINSLSGLEVSPAGVVRPTTSRPLVLTSEAGRMEGDMTNPEVVVGNAPILSRMTFVDTPDIDSTSTGHRLVAEKLIDRADIVVFVTSAIRYADDVPWEILRRAASRGATLVPVLNRVGPGSGGIFTDFRAKLRGAGIEGEPVRVPEHHLPAGAQRVPVPAVRRLRRRLFDVAKAQSDHRAEVLNRVLNATTRQVGEFAGRVSAIGSELRSIGSRMEDEMARAPEIVPDPSREWAALPVPAPRPGKGSRWRRRVARRSLPDWGARVLSGLVAELDTRLRSDLVTHAGPVITQTGITTLAHGSASMLQDAVRSWFALVGRIAEAAGEGGAASDMLVSAVLTGDGQPGLEAMVDDASERVTQARRDLEGRLAVIWAHYATRVAEVWGTMIGQLDVREVETLVADVAAAYQFADA